jgi:hypothetical protein
MPLTPLQYFSSLLSDHPDFHRDVATNFTTRAFLLNATLLLLNNFFSYFCPSRFSSGRGYQFHHPRISSQCHLLLLNNFFSYFCPIPIDRDVSTNFTTRAYLPLKNKKCEVNLTLFAPTNHPDRSRRLTYYERETRLELATPTLARSCSTN